MKRQIWTVAAAIVAGMLTSADAAQLTIERQFRPVTDVEVAGGATIGSFVHDFFITTVADILGFNNVAATAPIYHNPLGSESAAPRAIELELDPALSAHSFITTPGDTFIAGGDASIASGMRTYADTANSGAVSQFHFARLTTSGAGSFAGSVAMRGVHAPISIPFSFDLPGDAAGLASLASAPPFVFEYDDAAQEVYLNPIVPPAPLPNSYPIPDLDPAWDVSGPNSVRYFDPPSASEPTIPQYNPQWSAGLAYEPRVTSSPRMWRAPSQPAPPLVPEGYSVTTKPAPQNPGDLIAAIWRTSRAVTEAEAADGAPAGGIVNEFFVSTAVDILSVGDVSVTSPLYEHDAANPAEPTPALLTQFFPATGASSYITTPGSTAIAGGWLDIAWGERAYFDTEWTEAVDGFQFAQLTTTTDGIFRGRVFLRGDDGPLSLPFEFTLNGSAEGAQTGVDPIFSMVVRAPAPPVVVIPPAIPWEPEINGPALPVDPPNLPEEPPAPPSEPDPGIVIIVPQPPEDPAGVPQPDFDPTVDPIVIEDGQIRIIDWLDLRDWLDRPYVWNPVVISDIDFAQIALVRETAGQIDPNDQMAFLTMVNGLCLACEVDASTLNYAGDQSVLVASFAAALAEIAAASARAHVPEPTAVALIAAGGVLAVARGRRRARHMS